MIENINSIEKEELEACVKTCLDEGFRFITITCVEVENGFQLTYHFAQEYKMKHFRIEIKKDEELKSISDIYFCAMLVENELKDLFDLKIKDIVIDYGGKLLLSEGAPYAPMCNNISQEEVE